MTIRDTIRSAILSHKPKFRSELIEIEGQKVEFRQPSAAKRARIIKAAGVGTTLKAGKGEKLDKTEVDIAKLHCHAIAELTYVPGTEDNVFGVADFDVLLNFETEFFDLLADKAMALMNIDKEDLEKN